MNSVQRAAFDATLQRIHTLFPKIENEAKIASGAVVNGVNLGRELGLCFQELCAHEQMTLEFFQKVSGKLPAGIDFGFVQKCEWIARNVKQPVKSYVEAKQAEQMLLGAFGLVPESKRIGQQAAHSDNPVAWFLSTFSGISAHLKKFDGQYSQWTPAVRASAKAEIKRLKTELSDWETKLAS